MLERAVFEPMSSRTPSIIRWHTYGPAFEGGSLGKLLCDIVHRSLNAAKEINHVDADNGDVDGFRKQKTSKNQ